MAFTIDTAHTLPEAIRHLAPDGSYMWAFDEFAAKKYPLMEEMYWEQANDNTAHEFLKAVTHPTGALVRLEEGAPYEISVDRPVREQICRIESNMRVDTRVLEVASHPKEFYSEKEKRHLGGLVRTFHETAFSRVALKNGAYIQRGNQNLNPADVNGLGVRYGKLGENVVGLGASAVPVHSIWIVKHGPDGFFGIFPNEASRTVSVKRYDDQKELDKNGNPFRAVETNFAFSFGFGIMQDSAVQRICNIAESGNNSFFEDGTKVQKGEYALIDAVARLPGGSSDRAIMYVDRQVEAQIRKRLLDRNNINFNVQTIWGRPMLHFQDVPIMVIDALGRDVKADGSTPDVLV